jgi:hypothetical protein
MIKRLIEKLKALRLYFVRRSYFIWNKYFRSDKVKTQNGRIYSRKQIEKQMREYCANLQIKKNRYEKLNTNNGRKN